MWKSRHRVALRRLAAVHSCREGFDVFRCRRTLSQQHSNVRSSGATDIMNSFSAGFLAVALGTFQITAVAEANEPARSVYRPSSYELPTERPFVSLGAFGSSAPASAAYRRLKDQVDEAVAVTKTLSPTATYAQLVNALNSGNYGYSAADSVLMFHLSKDPKYILQAIRMVDMLVTSEASRISAGGVPVIAGDSYLEVGQHMEQLALTYDYGYDRLTPAQRAAWEAYAQQTLYNVWNHTKAQWGGVSRPWTGWSVSDPGNNYFYSFLKATQLGRLLART